MNAEILDQHGYASVSVNGSPVRELFPGIRLRPLWTQGVGKVICDGDGDGELGDRAVMAGKSAGTAVVVIMVFLTPAGSPQRDRAAPSSSPSGPAIGQLAAVARDAAADPPGLLAVLARVADPRRGRGVRHRRAACNGMDAFTALH